MERLFENFVEVLLTSLSLVNVIKLKSEAIKYSSRSYGHTLPAQGKETSSESGKSLSVNTLQRRLSGTSSVVFITTAITHTYANMLYNLLPHGSVFLAFYSSSNNQTAAISDRGPVKDTD